MLRNLKAGVLCASHRMGLFHLVANSRWRRERLLILCYHGVSLGDEHEWDNQLYMSPEQFENRLEFLRANNYRVLSLTEGIQRLYARDLPPKSMVITIDDGAYDCYRRAYPILKRFGWPFTVYLTTFYCDFNRPIFRLICSYMLWRKQGSVLAGRSLPGFDGDMDLRTAEGRRDVVVKLDRYTKEHDSSAQEKDDVAALLAGRIGVDYQAILEQRILHLMKPAEVREMAENGVDIQLHTHRHRTPTDKILFDREIADNDQRIQEITGVKPVHFCYPSGVYHPEFLPWLKELGVESATTCVPGLADRQADVLLLPRLVDHSSLSLMEFASWASGVRTLFPQREYPAIDPNL